MLFYTMPLLFVGISFLILIFTCRNARSGRCSLSYPFVSIESNFPVKFPFHSGVMQITALISGVVEGQRGATPFPQIFLGNNIRTRATVIAFHQLGLQRNAKFMVKVKKSF